MPEHAPKRSVMPLEQQIRNRYKDSVLPRHTSETTASLQIGGSVIHFDLRDGKLHRDIIPNTAKFSPTELSVFASIAKEAMEQAAGQMPQAAE